MIGVLAVSPTYLTTHTTHDRVAFTVAYLTPRRLHVQSRLSVTVQKLNETEARAEALKKKKDD
jgi:hypothetical protein